VPAQGPATCLEAVVFIRRIGSALNPHLHFRGVVLDGMFEATSAAGIIEAMHHAGMTG
jgi:hypothetical protein